MAVRTIEAEGRGSRREVGGVEAEAGIGKEDTDHTGNGREVETGISTGLDTTIPRNGRTEIAVRTTGAEDIEVEVLSGPRPDLGALKGKEAGASNDLGPEGKVGTNAEMIKSEGQMMDGRGGILIEDLGGADLQNCAIAGDERITRLLKCHDLGRPEDLVMEFTPHRSDL